MPNSYTCLQYHVIFSTKGRTPQIGAEFRERLFAYVGGIMRDMQARLIAAGGAPDHVHLLMSLHPQTALSDLLRQVKAGSSKWVHEIFPGTADFGWQDGYAAFTVSFSNVANVKTYIAEQEQHHRRVSFQDELLEFLRRHEIAYDERYIWT